MGSQKKTDLAKIVYAVIILKYLYRNHCESREGLWLQGEAAFEMHSFTDAEPQPVIQYHPAKPVVLSSVKTKLMN